MNAEKFFNTHSLEEISQKTKISPISLRLIRNKEFEKIPKVKFLGFIKIIEKTYNVDLSDLIEEFNNQTSQKEPQISIPQTTKSKNSTFFITLLALILIFLGGFLLFKNLNSKQPEISENKTVNIIKQNPQIPISQQPIQQISKKTTDKNNSVKKENEIIKKPLNKETNISNQKFEVVIIPNERLWFKAVNIDTNKSIQFLTSHKKILPKGNYYIKFGHGEFNLTYNNQTITPNTKKLIRILFENGKYKFMKKPNRFEK